MRKNRLKVAIGAAAAVTAWATPASAHVSIPEPADKGGFSIVALSVPNERPDAGTTKLEVKLPEDHPLPFVSVQPKPGWTVETTMRILDEPVDAFGESITEVVDTVVWTGGEIQAGEFDTFALSVGPLPDDVDELVFPAIQTYSSGEEVSWIEDTPPSGEEPDHPAPVLQLVDADSGADTPPEPVEDETAAAPVANVSREDLDDAESRATVALVVGALGLALGAAGIGVALRRRPVR